LVGRRFKLFLAAMCCPSFVRRVWAKQREVATRSSNKAVWPATASLPDPFGNLPQPHQGSSARHAPAGDLDQVSAFVRRQGRMLRQFEDVRAPVRRKRVIAVVITANGDERGPAQPLALEQLGCFERRSFG